MLKPYCVYEMLRKFFNLSFDSNKSVEAHGDWFVYWTSCKAATRDEGSTAPDFHVGSTCMTLLIRILM